MSGDAKTVMRQFFSAVVCALRRLCNMQVEPLEFAILSFLPFAMEEGGKKRGVFPDILLAMCKALTIQCEVGLYRKFSS